MLAAPEAPLALIAIRAEKLVLLLWILHLENFSIGTMRAERSALLAASSMDMVDVQE
jgi:hypothetical protein